MHWQEYVVYTFLFQTGLCFTNDSGCTLPGCQFAVAAALLSRDMYFLVSARDGVEHQLCYPAFRIYTTQLLSMLAVTAAMMEAQVKRVPHVR